MGLEIPKTKLNEDLEHKPTEGAKYSVSLDNIISDAKIIHDILDDGDELPSWVQDKITIAEHNMDAIKGYYESKLHNNHKYSSGSEEI